MSVLMILAAGTDAPEAEPTAWFLTPGGFVALAMIFVILIMLRAKVPAMIAGMLDSKIAGIRHQLDTAQKLRAEAEALLTEYQKKAKDADAEIAALTAGAHAQAEEIVAEAKTNAAALIARHQARSTAKIAAAELAAVSEIRQITATAASSAAAKLLAERIDAPADGKLVDSAIAGL